MVSDQAAAAELRRREIHRDAHRREPRVLPGARLPARLAHDPLADGADQAALLGERNEGVGRDQARVADASSE